MQTVEKALAELGALIPELAMVEATGATNWKPRLGLIGAMEVIALVESALRGYQPTEGEAAPSVTGEVVGEWPRVDVERKFDELYPDAEYRATDLEFFWAGVRHCEARLQRHLAPPPAEAASAPAVGGGNLSTTVNRSIQT
jgi:hypothetical protein